MTITVEKRVVDIPLEVSFGGGVTDGSGLETSAVINGTLEFASTNDENEENVLENEIIGSELEVEEMSGEELVTEVDELVSDEEELSSDEDTAADELVTSDEDLFAKVSTQVYEPEEKILASHYYLANCSRTRSW